MCIRRRGPSPARDAPKGAGARRTERDSERGGTWPESERRNFRSIRARKPLFYANLASRVPVINYSAGRARL